MDRKLLIVAVVALVGTLASLGAEAKPDGASFFSTFSICAIDPESGQSGVAVTTRVPFVGRAVPWVRAGVGAVATQSWTIVDYGLQGLDLLADGMSPDEAVEKLLADDVGRERRQIGLIDMQGRTAAFTGKENGEWAGSRQGANYTVQANIMVGPEVIDAVADSFEATADTGMPLAERLVLALAAGQETGGDRRWGNFQSAALRIADPNDPGRRGDHISVAIDVGEHPEPVAELERIYYTTARRLGYRSFSKISGPDVIELKRMLHLLGYWRPDLETFPDTPEFDGDRSIMRSDPEGYATQIKAYSDRAQIFRDQFGHYDDEAVQAVQAFREGHDLDYSGNPDGLVDERLVDALRSAYYDRVRQDGDD